MKPRGWAITDVGRRRDHNEDSYLCNDELALYAVADGMGGHQGGERASRMAVELLEQAIAAGWGELQQALAAPASGEGEGELGATRPQPLAAALRSATLSAARAIWEAAQADPTHAGMGTTLTSACFHADHVTICHVGDSRAYLYRDGKARQLTEDHSWIQEQIRAGLITEQDAMVSRFRNIITRSVGFESTVEPDLMTLPVELGDCFLLCSDGLSNHVEVADIEAVLAREFFGDAGRALVDLANERGGDDNITCVVVYVGNDPPSQQQPGPGRSSAP